MGEFRDMLDAMSDLKSEVKKGFASIGGYGKRRSIAASATDGTCYFPVVVDDSIPLEDALIVARALERKYATFVLTTLTMNPYMQIDNGDISAAEYVKRFHQNMRVKRSTTPAINLLDVKESAFDSICDKYGIDYSAVEEEAMVTAWNIYNSVVSSVANKNASKWNFTLEEMLTPSIVNDIGKVRPAFEARTVFSGGPGRTPDIDDDRIDQLKNDMRYSKRGNSRADTFVYNDVHSPSVNVKADPTINVKGSDVKVNPEINVNMPKGRAARPDPRQINHLMDTDFKKANDLVPTMLHIRVYPTASGDEELPEPIDFVLGVKATLHSVTADAMAENLAKGVNGDNHFFEFIKWYTGETRFFKDFVFAIDQQKSDAVSASNKNKGWFVASKRRKALSKLQSKISKNPMTPIMTIVTSKDTLETLANVYGFDLEASPMLLDKIMSTYFLLGFVVVNPATNRVDFHIDGFDSAETVTLNTLQKEETRDDKKFKDMMRMMGRSV